MPCVSALTLKLKIFLKNSDVSKPFSLELHTVCKLLKFGKYLKFTVNVLLLLTVTKRKLLLKNIDILK